MMGRRGTWVLLGAVLAILLMVTGAGFARAETGGSATVAREVSVVSGTSGWSDVTSESLVPYGLTVDGLTRVSQGYLDGRWNPGWFMEREQFAKMAASGYLIPPRTPAEPTFLDVDAGSLYYPFVEGVAEAGLIDGVAPRVFDPFATITRQQGAAIVARYLASALGFDLATDYDEPHSRAILKGFADADQVSPGLLSAVAFAVDFQILQGGGGLLRPAAALTRIEGAALITRALRSGEDPDPARSMGAMMDELGGPDALGTVGGGAEDWAGGRAFVFWKGDAALALAEGVDNGALPVDLFLPAYVRSTDAGVQLGLPKTSAREQAVRGIDYLYQTFSREGVADCDLLTFTGGPKAGVTELVWSGTFTALEGQPVAADLLQMELSRDSRVPTLLPTPALVTRPAALQVCYLYHGIPLFTVNPAGWPPDLAGLGPAAAPADVAFALGFAKGAYTAFREYASAQPGAPAPDVAAACVTSAWDVLRDASARLGRSLYSISPADVAAVDAWQGTPASELMTALALQMEIQRATSADAPAAADIAAAAQNAGFAAGEAFTATVTRAAAKAPYATVAEAAAAAKTADATSFVLLTQALALGDLLQAERAAPRPWVTLLQAVSVDEFVLGGLYNKWPTSPSFVPDGLAARGRTVASLGDLETRPLVRFYTKGTGYAKGKWWGLLADFKGLWAAQVEDALALPTATTHYVLGEIKPGTELAVGPAAAWPVDSGYPMTRMSHGVEVTTQERVGGPEQIMILSDPGPTFDWDQYIEFETDAGGMLVEHAIAELLVP